MQSQLPTGPQQPQVGDFGLDFNSKDRISELCIKGLLECRVRVKNSWLGPCIEIKGRLFRVYKE